MQAIRTSTRAYELIVARCGKVHLNAVVWIAIASMLVAEAGTRHAITRHPPDIIDLVRHEYNKLVEAKHGH